MGPGQLPPYHRRAHTWEVISAAPPAPAAAARLPASVRPESLLLEGDAPV